MNLENAYAAGIALLYATVVTVLLTWRFVRYLKEKK